jgi:transposase-like protein
MPLTSWSGGIKRKTRKQYSAEEKIRIVLAGLRGEESISALCRREGIAESLYYSWSKEFLEAGKQRLAGEPPLQTRPLSPKNPDDGHWPLARSRLRSIRFTAIRTRRSSCCRPTARRCSS